MTRVETLNWLYAASTSLAMHGVEIVAVGDPRGSRLDRAARRLIQIVRDEGPQPWEDLLGAVRALRWRLVTQPQPICLNAAIREGASAVCDQVHRLRGAVADELFLNELEEAVRAVCTQDPPVGEILLSSIAEVGSSECVVVAASQAAQMALKGWLDSSGIRVVTAGELEDVRPRAGQAYAIGPPRFFRSALVTAPVVDAVTYILPTWFSDRSMPHSPFAPYADGGIRIKAQTFLEGDLSEPGMEVSDVEAENALFPQVLWGGRDSDREPGSEEVRARKVLLNGGLAMWLDDGDRIRALDPNQPAGERVVYTEIEAVRTGTYLLLRKGETERGILYRAALSMLGELGGRIEDSQHEWKSELAKRLAFHGDQAVAKDLLAEGVKAVHRAHAWIDPKLIRPHSDQDFAGLLSWLGIPLQPAFAYATTLRRTIYQASARVRDELEMAVAGADLSALARDGSLSLTVKAIGVRGLVATRVTAVAPYTEIVARNDARVPFEDRTSRWLE